MENEVISVLVATVVAASWLPWPSVSCANDPRLQNGKYAAVYSPEHKTIVLSLNICGNLERLQDDRGPVYYENAHALFTLSHELAHAGGVGDEHEADCRAELIWPNVARRIRVPQVKVKVLRTIMPRLDFPRLLHGESCIDAREPVTT